jgi:hypothetical protein
MKPFPQLVLFVTAAGGYALPISAAASGTLLFVAGVAAIITIDYGQRYRGLPMPRKAVKPAAAAKPRVVFRAPPLRVEPNRLAA